MLTRCAQPGCETFVLGGFCLVHDVPPSRIFVRGRPFVPRVEALPLGDVPPRGLALRESMAVVVEPRAEPEAVLR